MRPHAVRKILATKHQGVLTTKKQATKNTQILLQHCWKTSWKAMLHVLPPTFKPVNNLICCKTGLIWLVKRVTSLCNSFCCNFAKQVACFLLPVFPYLKGAFHSSQTSGLNFRQLPVANGTGLSKISQKEDNLARHTQILETFIPLFPSFRKFCGLNAGKRSKDYISPLFTPWTN